MDPLAEQTMTPYQYVNNNPIMFTDPTGMSAEQGGDGFWSNIANKAKSLLGINSGQPGVSPIEHTELDEITVSANRKSNWFQRNFSRDKFSRDWKNNKEKSGYNHAANYVEDNRENISNAWNSPLARTAVPDKVGVSLSSSVTAVAGLNVGFNFDWITRGNDARITPYVSFTIGGQAGSNVSADALIGIGGGYYPTMDMRSLQKGQASRDLLGWGASGSIDAGVGLGGSITGSVGFQKQPLISRPTWISGSFSAGASIGGGATGGVGYTFPIFSNQFND